MKNLKIRGFLGLVVFAALAAWVGVYAPGDAAAQVKKGKTRLMETRHLMKGVVKPSVGALKKGLKTEPADDDAWDDLAMAAALLNEASFLLMDDGRCPDGVWSDAASKTLREGSAATLNAIEAKDLDASRAALKKTTQSCKECHKKHKED